MADTKMEETMEQEVENSSGDKAADSMETTTDTAEASNDNSDAKMETTATPGDGEQEEAEYVDNEVYQNLRSQSVKPKVAVALIQLYECTEITSEDLDERAIDMLRSFPTEQAIHVIEEVKKCNLLGVQNHAQFMMSMMRNFRDIVRQSHGASALSTSLVTGPSHDSTKALLDRTGYSLEVTNGQRKYGGPPPEWDGPTTGPAGHGNEIYIGRIPNDIYEDTLVPLFEEVGKIWDLRLMMDPITCKNRGYAFMTFCEKKCAAEASKKFDGHEILPGKNLKVNVSVANTRLFVGNIPKSKSKEEILAEFKELTEGVEDCIIYTSPDAGENRKNRGFCFLDFVDHKSASDAKRRIHTGKLRAFNFDLVVDWAEQQQEPDEETMAKVKILYVRNLKDVVTETQLKEAFGVHGEIDHVKKIKDYAFIHFTERDSAVKALEALNGTELEGASMEVSLAKPQGDRKKNMRGRGRVFGSNRGGFNNYYSGRGNTRDFRGGYGAQRSYGAPMDYGYGGYDPYSYGVSSGYTDMYSYPGGYSDYNSYGYAGGADPYSSYASYAMRRGGAMGGGGGYSPRGGMSRGQGGGRGGVPRGGKRSADVTGGPSSKREFGWGGM